MKHIPAFPVVGIQEQSGHPTIGVYETGMTLRDYFAAKALQALVNAKYFTGDHARHAKASYDYADAMLKAREVQ